ncbi:MAG: hypothetical protein K2W95_16265 [Candidatus Obscuribacterales bacterium]|nr:hypothetical protein [Candidatus Obscuribacterales bacterium]
MSEDKIQVRKALLEAVTAQKLIEKKLEAAHKEIASLKKLLERPEPEPSSAASEQNLTKKIRQQELLIAEFEADRLSQNDLEKQLQATLFRLEHSVKVTPQPKIDDINGTRATIDRMEGKVFKQEARAELSAKDNAQHKLKADTEAAAIEDELSALKKSLAKDQDD